MDSRKASIIFIILVGLIAAFFIFNQQEKKIENKISVLENNLIPATEITHGHGLAVDATDPNKVYIATHHGLMVLVNDKDLYHVGTSKDDYMGFSPHPTDSKVFFSSGHPVTGGNIGFQKSEDQGLSWRKVSSGVNGPVDFHAMAVSPADPNLIYGWYAGNIQRSNDQGKTWEIVSATDFPVVNLAADPKDENIVYASTPQGLIVSNNKGSEWSKLLDGSVSVLSVNPQDSQKLISYSGNQQLVKSNDAGKTWEKINADFKGETPLFISYNKQNPQIIYLLTEKNSIYKSLNGALTWNIIR